MAAELRHPCRKRLPSSFHACSRCIIFWLTDVFSFDQGRRRPHNPLGDRNMGISKKGRHKFDFNGVQYLWWVREDYETYSPGNFLHVYIARCDKQLVIAFQLGQSPDTCHLTIQHDGQSSCWRRLRCPVFDQGPSFTPRNVRTLLEWFTEYSGDAEEVNYLGLSLP